MRPTTSLPGVEGAALGAALASGSGVALVPATGADGSTDADVEVSMVCDSCTSPVPRATPAPTMTTSVTASSSSGARSLATTSLLRSAPAGHRNVPKEPRDPLMQSLGPRIPPGRDLRYARCGALHNPGSPRNGCTTRWLSTGYPRVLRRQAPPGSRAPRGASGPRS